MVAYKLKENCLELAMFQSPNYRSLWIEQWRRQTKSLIEAAISDETTDEFYVEIPDIGRMALETEDVFKFAGEVTEEHAIRVIATNVFLDNINRTFHGLYVKFSDNADACLPFLIVRNKGYGSYSLYGEKSILKTYATNIKLGNMITNKINKWVDETTLIGNNYFSFHIDGEKYDGAWVVNFIKERYASERGFRIQVSFGEIETMGDIIVSAAIR